MKRNQSQISSKAISTIPSIQQMSPPRVHPYHQYETLLNFITSFITDFRFHINQLKQLTYNIVGFDPYLLNQHENNLKNIECQYCEVEYIIKSCRNTRDDIVRILSILRGCSSFRNQNIKNKKTEYQGFNTEVTNQNMQDNRYYQQITLMNLKNEHNRETVLNTCNMGMLTFRQLQISREEQIQSKNWSSRFKIIQQNNETSRSQENTSLMIQTLQQKLSKQSQKSVLKCSKWKNQFQKAYMLIKLIKQQVPNLQTPQISKVKGLKDNLDIVMQQSLPQQTIKAS